MNVYDSQIHLHTVSSSEAGPFEPLAIGTTGSDYEGFWKVERPHLNPDFSATVYSVSGSVAAHNTEIAITGGLDLTVPGRVNFLLLKITTTSATGVPYLVFRDGQRLFPGAVTSNSPDIFHFDWIQPQTSMIAGDTQWPDIVIVNYGAATINYEIKYLLGS